MAETLALIAKIVVGVATVGGTAAAYSQNKEAVAEAEKAQSLNRAKSEESNRRARLRMLQEVRIRNAQVANKAGPQGSSASSGEQSATLSQFGERVGASFVNESFDQQISRHLQSSANASNRAGGYQMLGSLAGNLGGQQSVQKFFEDLWTD
jgi:hypothetical protein